MNVRNLLSLALAITLAGATIPGSALAQAASPYGSGGKWWEPNRGGWNHGTFEGRWVAEDRFGQENRGSRGSIALPSVLRIDQGRRLVRIADARNNVLQLIGIENDYRMPRTNATYLTGELRGSRLVAHGEDPRGRELKQTLALRNGGRTLVIRTQVMRRSSGRMLEFERTYHRA